MGRPILVLLLASLLCACSQKPEECKSWASDSTGAGWSQCGDKQERKLVCPPSTIADQPQVCTCEVDGAKGNTFALDDTATLATLDSATKIANQNCGWKLTR